MVLMKMAAAHNSPAYGESQPHKMQPPPRLLLGSKSMASSRCCSTGATSNDETTVTPAISRCIPRTSKTLTRWKTPCVVTGVLRVLVTALLGLLLASGGHCFVRASDHVSTTQQHQLDPQQKHQHSPNEAGSASSVEAGLEGERGENVRLRRQALNEGTSADFNLR